ncbi:MAG TPA: TonB-dependent receptor [Pyrinomonadaceae bacterium]
MPRIPDVCSSAFCPPDKISNAKVTLTLSPLLALTSSYLRCFASAASLLLLFTVNSSLLSRVYAQSSTATLTGTVSDQAGAVVPGVKVAVINIDQGFQRSTLTNDEGIYTVSILPPGKYTVKAEREGFSTAEVPAVVLNINAYIKLNISLKIGKLEQQVEINYNPSLIDERPVVGGKVDSKLMELPQNGRTWQNLITLLPGIQFSKATGVEQGQFSVNGQRPNANSFYIDGVSANIGVAVNANGGQSAAGSLPGLSASGGTNNLVSIDAMQEFEVETSTYAPEYGRTSGAQVIVATRPGTNEFHGTLFEIFRNDVLDANDWFANSRRQGKPPLRQNNFGGVLGGPVLLPRFGEGGKQLWYNGKDKTFFFFSYEGLRLRQPLFGITQVPSLAARQSAPARIKPFLNAFPQPNGPTLANNSAEFAAGFSNPSSFDATSLRIDHHFNDKLSVFVRYNTSPSESIQRGTVSTSLNTLDSLRVETKTLTGAATLLLGAKMVAELRANYSHNSALRSNRLDSFGGAVLPADSLLFPSFASRENSSFSFGYSPGTAARFTVGRGTDNLQRQLNLVNSLAILGGSHEWKFGVDFKRLSPSIGPRAYSQSASFTGGANGAVNGVASSVSVQSQIGPVVPIYLNFSLYGQDRWKVTRRLSFTYGLRYEVNPPPHEVDDKDPATLVQVDNPATFTLGPPHQVLWKTTYNNFAPRFGVHFLLRDKPGRETSIRGGYGLFYDLGTGVAGQAFNASFPYAGVKILRNISFPLTSPADILPPVGGSLPLIQMYAFDPELRLPYTHQWNFAVEQSLGRSQTISASYVAALGRRLLRQELFGGAILRGNPLFSAVSQVFVTRNAATSDFHSFQLKFQRRLTNNFQALAYYTWSHSIDTASTESAQFGPALVFDPNRDRGSSDFDVRHSANLSLTYDLPSPNIGKIGKSIFGHWTFDTIVAARSAQPVEVGTFRDLGFGNIFFRPDLIEGKPLYIDDSTVGGDQRFNRAAFVVPTQQRQGTLGRNVLRAFPLFQTDFGLARRFKLTETAALEFKAEFFNVFNHPNFGDPVGDLDDPRFGTSFRMFGRALGSGGISGGLNPLYQVGGPRSIQLSLKARF